MSILSKLAFWRKPKVEEDNRRLFFYHDLDKWDYVGRTRISFTYGPDEKEASIAQVFGFCSKENVNVRSYHIAGNHDRWKNHGWIVTMAEPWKAGFKELYEIVGEEPSPFLKEYMLREYQSKWDKETHWWKVNDASKYEAAQKEQKEHREEKKEVDNSEEKVVKFPKKSS